MFNGHRKKQRSKLASQIRLSYIILLLPNLIFMVYALYNLFFVSERYNTMLNSVVTASEFSLDFKEDFDYETYLLIVGNVAPEDSQIPVLLSDASLKVLRARISRSCRHTCCLEEYAEPLCRCRSY